MADAKATSYDSLQRSPHHIPNASPVSIGSTAKGKAELLQMAVNESKGEIQSLRSNVGTLQDTISGHARVLQQYKNQLREREEENRQLHHSAAALKRELAELRREKDDSDRSQHKYTNLTSRLQQELDEVRSSSTRYRQDFELAVQRSDAAEHALEELRRVQAQMADELARTQEALRRAEDQGAVREASLQQNAVSVQVQYDEAFAELRELKVKVAEYQVALQERERELQGVQERSRQQGLEALQGQEELARLRRQLSETSLQVQALSERTAAQDQARRQMEGEIDMWCTRHDESQRLSEDLRRQLEDRVGEIERLQRAVHGKDDEIEELRERGRYQASQVGEHEAGIRSLEKQLQERVEHISYLEAKLQAQEKDLFERTAKGEDMARERAALQQQIEKLNADLDDTHAEVLRTREETSGIREQARADVEEYRRQASAIKGELSNARARIAQLEGKLATIEDFRADLQSQLRDSEAQNQQYQARIADQRKELSEWGAVIVKLQGEKEELASQVDMAQQDKASLQAQVQRQQGKQNEYREELRVVREELAAQHDLGARRDQEIELLQRSIEDKQMHIASLDEKCDKNSQLLADKMREIRNLQQHLDDERNQVSAAGIEISRLEGRIHAKEDEVQGLRDKNAHLKDNVQRMEVQLRRLENLPSVVETQEAEIDRMRHSLSRMEDENQSQARNSHSLQQRLAEKEAAQQSLQMKVNEMGLELQNLSKMRDELQAQLSDKAQDGIRLKGTIARLEGKVDAMEDAVRQWEGKCMQSEADKEAIRNTLDATADEKAAALRELNLIRDRTEALEATRDAAERQANEASMGLMRAKEEVEDLKDIGAQMNAELQRLRQLQHLPKVLEGKEQEVARLQEALHRVEHQADSTANVVREITGRSTELETVLNEKDREIAEIKRELGRKAHDAEQAMGEVLTKSNEVSRLKSNLARLEGRFQVMAEASEGEKSRASMLEEELRQSRGGEHSGNASYSTTTRWRSASGRISPRRDRSMSPTKPTPAEASLTVNQPMGRRASAITGISARHFSPMKREEAAASGSGGSPTRGISRVDSVSATPIGMGQRGLSYHSHSRVSAVSASGSVRGSPHTIAGRSPPRSRAYTPRTYQ